MLTFSDRFMPALIRNLLALPLRADEATITESDAARIRRREAMLLEGSHVLIDGEAGPASSSAFRASRWHLAAAVLLR